MGKLQLSSMLAKGPKVFAVDVRLEALEETKSIIDKEGGKSKATKANVSKSSEVSAMVGRAWRPTAVLTFSIITSVS